MINRSARVPSQYSARISSAPMTPVNAPQNVARIMCTDPQARHHDQHRRRQIPGTCPPHSVQQEARRDGDDRCGVIGWKRGIGAAGDQEMGDAGIIREHPLDEQQDELVERKTEQKGEAGGDENMPGVLPIVFPPPLAGNGEHENGNADR